MSPDLSHEELLSMLDSVLAEAPTDADDIAAELSALVLEYRDARQTERPGER